MKVKSMADLIKRVKKLQEKKVLGDEVVYRGQRGDHKLVPSLLRDDIELPAGGLHQLEDTLFCDAWAMGAGEASETKNSWEALALFQHYDVPTRLLDWTYSLTSAMFFAVIDCLNCKKSECKPGDCHGTPVVWALDPRRMHTELHPGRDIDGRFAITVGVDRIQCYKEVFINDHPIEPWKYRNGPVLLQIPWASARIKNQKGFFTFHYDHKPLEELLSEETGLVEIEISEESVEAFRKDFLLLGVNEYDIFADLASLGKYLKRRYTR